MRVYEVPETQAGVIRDALSNHAKLMDKQAKKATIMSVRQAFYDESHRARELHSFFCAEPVKPAETKGSK